MNLKESIDIKIIYWDDEPTEYLDDITHNDIVDIQNDPNVYKIVDVTNGKKKTIYLAESKKSTRKSIKESKSLTDLCNSWVIGDVVGKFKNRDYCHKGNDYSVFNIGNIIEDALRDNYILEFDGDNKAKSVIFYMIDKDGKNVGSLEIYPDERYEISNYEDGYDLNELDMDEIADLFYKFQKNKIEYLLSDKRFNFTDKFWYNESKKSVRKSLNEKVDSKFKYTFNHSKDDYEIMQFDDHNFAILAVPNGKSLFSDNLPKFKIEKTYIYDTCVNNRDITLFVGIVEELGWCFIAFDKLANNNNIFAYFISGKTKEGAYHAFHEYKQEFDLRIEEKKSIKESKVDFQSVIDKVIPKEYAHNKNAYKYALHCVESLYNEDEYDSDNAKVYFLNCYISDLFPSWVDDLGEEEMDALANSLYDGLFKWSEIDSSWLK